MYVFYDINLYLDIQMHRGVYKFFLNANREMSTLNNELLVRHCAKRKLINVRVTI